MGSRGTPRKGPEEEMLEPEDVEELVRQIHCVQRPKGLLCSWTFTGVDCINSAFQSFLRIFV